MGGEAWRKAEGKPGDGATQKKDFGLSLVNKNGYKKGFTKCDCGKPRRKVEGSPGAAHTLEFYQHCLRVEVMCRVVSVYCVCGVRESSLKNVSCMKNMYVKLKRRMCSVLPHPLGVECGESAAGRERLCGMIKAIHWLCSVFLTFFRGGQSYSERPSRSARDTPATATA